MFFHLRESWEFFNELVKSNGTSHKECELYMDWHRKNIDGTTFYNRCLMASIMIPYAGFCVSRRGIALKAMSFYGIVCMLEAIHDTGIYLNFFFHGPGQMRTILELDQKKHFASI